MSKNQNPIARSMMPTQMATQQSIPNPREFSPTDWSFNLGRAYQLDYNSPMTQDLNDTNYFDRNEEYKTTKNSMFNPLTGREPIFGQVNYNLNPLNQEQTNSQTVAYKQFGISRVAYNMNPTGVMRFPTYQYPYKNWLASSM